MHVNTRLAEQCDDDTVHALDMLHVTDADLHRDTVASQTPSDAGLDLRCDVLDGNRAFAAIRSAVRASAL